MTHDSSAASKRIEDYALISSAHGAGLVSRDGTIAWLCMPRFDSDALFASLLGNAENGSWRIGSVDPEASINRRYLPGSVILETIIRTASGTARVTDFMPHPGEGGTHEPVRIIEGDEGEVELETDLRLAFDYGSWRPRTEHRAGAFWAFAGPDALRLSTTHDLDEVDISSPTRIRVTAGQSLAATLEWFPAHLSPPLPRDPFALLRDTRNRMQGWAKRVDYGGPHQELYRRSLLTLKALTYLPSGGIVAAPTTSLPEWFGGSRNWDYRYCWVRDAVLTVHALGMGGFHEEAACWVRWLIRVAAGAPDQLRIMYGLHGERRLSEVELDHLSGFRDSLPVRIGNAAHGQVQLDIYGGILGAFDAARRAKLPDVPDTWDLEVSIAGHLLSIWREPDSGLWEARGEPRHYVYSKLMCWVGFDRIIASAEDFGLAGPVEDWRQARSEIHQEICERGFDPRTNSFTQSYGDPRVDAALLQMPLRGFLPIDDPRMQGTIDRIENELVRDGLVYRYLIDDDGSDGLSGEEAAFVACSFWLCDVYAVSGRLEEAQAFLDQLVRLSNDLGLFGEEYDPKSQTILGNFPQAFSHLALINTLQTLDAASRADGSALDAQIFSGHVDQLPSMHAIREGQS